MFRLTLCLKSLFTFLNSRCYQHDISFKAIIMATLCVSFFGGTLFYVKEAKRSASKEKENNMK